MASAMPFIIGGISGTLATACIQPIDMVKVRIQLGQSGANPFTVASHIIKTEGFGSLYKGLSAGALRQVTYTTARLGLFDTFKAGLVRDGRNLTFAQSTACGLAAGGLAAVVGNPADLALIRMQTQSTLPQAQRAGYTNVFQTLSIIAQKEGILGWWKGCGPTVVRAMALNVGMLSTNDQAKRFTDVYFEHNPVASQFLSKALAGFFASALSLPFDFVKTRMQKQVVDPATGKPQYSSTLNCVSTVARTEGLRSFYKGFWTYYVRIAPHAMLTLTFAELLKKEFEKQR